MHRRTFLGAVGALVAAPFAPLGKLKVSYPKLTAVRGLAFIGPPPTHDYEIKFDSQGRIVEAHNATIQGTYNGSTILVPCPGFHYYRDQQERW